MSQIESMTQLGYFLFIFVVLFYYIFMYCFVQPSINKKKKNYSFVINTILSLNAFVSLYLVCLIFFISFCFFFYHFHSRLKRPYSFTVFE